MDNEFLLQDRLQKIRQIIRKYGEENFYLSFSGGKDSTVLSALCEIIWKPVYEEYRRIGYRLKPLESGRQMSLEEFTEDEEIQTEQSSNEV